MALYYERDHLCRFFTPNVYKDFIELDIAFELTQLATIGQTFLSNLPPLITLARLDTVSIWSRCLTEYIIYFEAINRRQRQYVKLTKRLVFLSLKTNYIYTTNSSHSHIENRKKTVVTILPSSLVYLDIEYNYVFRLILISSPRSVNIDFCCVLKETRFRESLICIRRFLYYTDQVRLTQKSIKWCRLTFNSQGCHRMYTVKPRGTWDGFKKKYLFNE